MIDLHVHTTMSDGTVSPREVVRLAALKGLQAIAITDHDTVAGVAPAQEEGRVEHVEVVAGVEISSQWEGGILHVLGYFVSLENLQLRNSLKYLQRGRIERVPKILSKLKDQDVIVTVDEVHREAQGGVPGRPHVANVLLHKGSVRTLQEAFDRYLKRGAPAYVEKVKLPPAEAIRVIVEAEGVPVLAHPYSLNQADPRLLERTLRSLIDLGLQGIEVYYPKHTPQQTNVYLDLASRLDLVVTGGTDFHGTNKPAVKLGMFPGQGPMPYSLLEGLKSRKVGLPR